MYSIASIMPGEGKKKEGERGGRVKNPQKEAKSLIIKRRRLSFL